MRRSSLGLALGLALFAPMTPAMAQQELRDIISGVAGALLEQEMDKTAYAEAQNRNTAAAYRSYLQRFPKGAFRGDAERALVRLGAVAEPALPQPVPTPEPAPTPVPPPAAGVGSAASIEAAIGLSRADRIVLQQQLTKLGYDTGTPDGLWGGNTRDAIRRWQDKNKVTATGYLTARQVATIRQQAGPSPAPGTPPVANPDTDDRIEENLLGLSSAERREIQQRLTTLGYNTRGADGVFGRNTRIALANWQADHGLKVTGYITADQIRELRRRTGS